VKNADGTTTYLRRSQAEGKQVGSASIAGSADLSPEALRFTAEQYLTGDRQAVIGYARNASARVALQNEIVKVAKERGMSGSEVAAKMADFAGIMSGSRTVGTRAAQIELASSEALKMIDIVKNTSGAFSRTNFVPWNRVIEQYDKQTGKPEVMALGAAINSLVNVYARAVNPSGVATISDKDHAREMLARIQSPEQIDAVLGIMQQEMAAARAAPLDVREATRQAVTGERAAPGSAAPARRATDNPPATNSKGWRLMVDKNGNKAYVGPKGEIEEVK
jgi:hypothetical protein